jgi:hypothetical protein
MSSTSQLVMVECKLFDKEGQPLEQVWEKGAEHLRNYYLGGLREAHTVFGAVAIRTRIRFFELVGTDLRDFEGCADSYMLDRQCQSVSKKLTRIRESLTRGEYI